MKPDEVRSSRGIKFQQGPPLNAEFTKFKDESSSCRDMTFTKDGKLFSWCTNQSVNIAPTSNYENSFQVDGHRFTALHFSPKGTYLSSWEPYTGVAPNTMLAKVCSDQNKPHGQYQISSSAEAVKSFISSLPVKKVSGIGPVQGQILNAIGIHTCADMWIKRDLVASLFTSNSVDFYMRVALGIGSTTVKRSCGFKCCIRFSKSF